MFCYVILSLYCPGSEPKETLIHQPPGSLSLFLTKISLGFEDIFCLLSESNLNLPAFTLSQVLKFQARLQKVL
jgi:hypothetical protein